MDSQINILIAERCSSGVPGQIQTLVLWGAPFLARGQVGLHGPRRLSVGGSRCEF